MENRKFWTRVAHWFKQEVGTAGNRTREAPTDACSYRPTTAVGSPQDTEQGRAQGRSGSASGLRSAVREPDPIAEFARTLEQALAHQQERLVAVHGLLERLVQTADGAPRLIETCAEPLLAIRESVSDSTTAIRRVEERLMPLPQLADAQRETMVSVGRQVDDARQAQDRSSKVMDELRQDLAELTRTAENMTRLFQSLQDEEKAREQRLTEFLEAWGRRLAWFGWSVVALAAALVVIEFISLF